MPTTNPLDSIETILNIGNEDRKIYDDILECKKQKISIDKTLAMRILSHILRLPTAFNQNDLSHLITVMEYLLEKVSMGNIKTLFKNINRSISGRPIIVIYAINYVLRNKRGFYFIAQINCRDDDLRQIILNRDHLEYFLKYMIRNYNTASCIKMVDTLIRQNNIIVKSQDLELITINFNNVKKFRYTTTLLYWCKILLENGAKFTSISLINYFEYYMTKYYYRTITILEIVKLALQHNSVEDVCVELLKYSDSIRESYHKDLNSIIGFIKNLVIDRNLQLESKSSTLKFMVKHSSVKEFEDLLDKKLVTLDSELLALSICARDIKIIKLLLSKKILPDAKCFPYLLMSKHPEKDNILNMLLEHGLDLTTEQVYNLLDCNYFSEVAHRFNISFDEKLYYYTYKHAKRNIIIDSRFEKHINQQILKLRQMFIKIKNTKESWEIIVKYMQKNNVKPDYYSIVFLCDHLITYPIEQMINAGCTLNFDLAKRLLNHETVMKSTQSAKAVKNVLRIHNAELKNYTREELEASFDIDLDKL